MLDITVDPAPAATDLREIRAATKQALIRHREVPDERQALLPLVPLLPQRLTRRMVGVATGGATNVVVSSNLGAAPAAVNRPDGTDADYFAVKSLYPRVTKAMMHRIGGATGLALGKSAPTGLRLGPCVSAGPSNSNDDLWQDLSSVLSDFSLTATIGLAEPATSEARTDNVPQVTRKGPQENEQRTRSV